VVLLDLAPGSRIAADVATFRWARGRFVRQRVQDGLR
jgi:hypothetical protein